MNKKEAKKLLKDYKDFLNKEIPIYTKISDYSLNKYIKEQLHIPDVVVAKRTLVCDRDHKWGGVNCVNCGAMPMHKCNK